MAETRRSLEQKQNLLKTVKLSMLPDGGAKLKEQVRQLEEKLSTMEHLSLESTSNVAPQIVTLQAPVYKSDSNKIDQLQKQLQMKKWTLGNANGQQRERLRSEITALEREITTLSIASKSQDTVVYKPISVVAPTPIQLLPEFHTLSADVQRRMYAEQPADKQLYQKGRLTAAQRREAASVTSEALENLHQSLATCPSERESTETPADLVVPLLPHQTRALRWLLWRETQNPPGGILADDMGLGKTLTMISLIVKQRELSGKTAHSESNDWLSKELKIKKSSGTLIVCPASVIGQWDNEIQRRCKKNALRIITYHGPDRHRLAAKLYKADVVLTTYQIITREISFTVEKKDEEMGPIGDFDEKVHAKEIRQSPLLQIAWERIILDEAHTIRNPKAQVSQAVCRLRAARRWAVTGTPVQNKELDMYSLLRFLRVAPFDQLQVWKRWVDSKTPQGIERLNLLIKTLLLRRTKDQKCEDTGKPIVEMPFRELHTHQLKLSEEEYAVYQKILDFSRKALEQYLKTQKQKEMEDDWSYQPNRKSRDGNGNNDVTKHHLLVLLLRLRQACSHPALIKTMLETTDPESMGSDAKIDESDDLDLVSQLASMNLDGEKEKPEDKNFFTLSNPVFQSDKLSSKMKTVIDEVERVAAQGQKSVIVSQWTSMLDIFALHLRKRNLRTHLIAGNIPVKQRTAVVDDFNTNPKGPPVMLLSLAAGGVGLNLIGGNHLFLTDMHWNPQLEAQACDRVYRVGQEKGVHVHRFITLSTVEERIVELQKRKLDLASGILTGAKNVTAKGLTLEDLKLLFNPASSVVKSGSD